MTEDEDEEVSAGFDSALADGKPNESRGFRPGRPPFLPFCAIFRLYVRCLRRSCSMRALRNNPSAPARNLPETCPRIARTSPRAQLNNRASVTTSNARPPLSHCWHNSVM